MTVSSIVCIKCDRNIFYFTVNTLWQCAPFCALSVIETYFISLETHYDSVLYFCALSVIETYFISLETHYDNVLHFVH